MTNHWHQSSNWQKYYRMLKIRATKIFLVTMAHSSPLRHYCVPPTVHKSVAVEHAGQLAAQASALAACQHKLSALAEHQLVLSLSCTTSVVAGSVLAWNDSHAVAPCHAWTPSCWYTVKQWTNNWTRHMKLEIYDKPVRKCLRTGTCTNECTHTHTETDGQLENSASIPIYN